MYGIFFIEIYFKILFLKKCVILLDVDIYLLVVFCLKDKKYYDILWDDIEDIVLIWFEYVLEYYCGKIFKGYKLLDFLFKFYFYVGDIFLNDWF